MELQFSFIIPVYNRPDEVHELLQSLTELDTDKDCEIVIIEDGSSISSESVVALYKDKLQVSYYFKPNSGPGDSRNYGMRVAKGNYFIILDSDCILPKNYLKEIEKSLNCEFVDCYGGPDTAHKTFSNIQKAIDFSMTSFITTGGIRGKKNSLNTFQPRSFNMGISKKAFLASGGFGKIHPGEDPDLSIRLWDLGFKTKLIPEAFVYHKRRISWAKFYKQVHKFGLVRPILNLWHPQTSKIIYWFPTLFSLGLLLAFILYIYNVTFLLLIFGLYFTVAFVLSLIKFKNLAVSFLAIVAIIIQFFGYGYGFLKSSIAIGIFKNKPERYFPYLFFN